MNVKEHASDDIDVPGGGKSPPCTGLAPDVLPEVQKPVLAENKKTGVSTGNALSGAVTKKPEEVLHWYALRVTYGREKKAYDYLVGKNVEAFCPTVTTVKVVAGKRRSVEESRLPNIFFARGTEEEIKSFVYDNVNLPHLRFYYRYFRKGSEMVKEPLTVPDDQMESFRIICTSRAEDIILVPSDIHKFEAGQTVRIIDGAFKGVIGKVARYHGQQRVAVIIEGLLTIATAYVPSAFLEEIL